MAKKYNILLFFFIFSALSFSQYQVRNFYSITGKKDIPINTIAQDHTGFLWLGASDGIYKFDGRTAVELFENHPVLTKDITAIFFDHDDRAWIGTKQGKVYFYSRNRLDSLDLINCKIESKITSFCELNSKLIIGTYGNGIIVRSEGKISQINSETGLSDDVVYKTISDDLSNVWCATDAGISKINFSKDKPAIEILSDNNGLPDNIVRDISLNNNKLFISMQDSGLCFYNLASKQFEKNPFFSNWALGAVLNATANKSNKIIIATEKNGLLIFKNSLLTVYDYESQIQNSSINQLFVDREQQIWLASKKGISQFTVKINGGFDQTAA